MARAAAPFTGWPSHWVGPTGFAWYVRPAVLITQARGTRGTLEGAQYATRIVDATLSACSDEVAAAKGLLIVNDWRQVTSWDLDARRHMMQRVRSDSLRNIRGIFVVMKLSPLVGAALQTACMLYSLAGTPMHVATDVTPILIQHGIVTPGAMPAELADAVV
jgi:hypothetical protein